MTSPRYDEKRRFLFTPSGTIILERNEDQFAAETSQNLHTPEPHETKYDHDDDTPLQQILDDMLPLQKPEPNTPVKEHQNAGICRICLDTEGQMFSPCKCCGSMKYVHRECLKQWRGINRMRPTYARCDMCRTPYLFAVTKREDSLVGFITEKVDASLISLFVHVSILSCIIVTSGFIGVYFLESSIEKMIEREEIGWITKIPNGVCFILFDYHIFVEGWLYTIAMGLFLTGLGSFANIGIVLNFRGDNSTASILVMIFVAILGLFRVALMLRSMHRRLHRELLLRKSDHLEVVEYHDGIDQQVHLI